jgi:hypothetical protein
MAQRTIGWVHQVSDSQYMSVRSAEFGGLTSFHSNFGAAKAAVESAVSHICKATKEDVVPTRWLLTDTSDDSPFVCTE